MKNKNIVIAMPLEADLTKTVMSWASHEDFSGSDVSLVHFVRQEYSGYEMTVVTYPDDKVFSEMKPVFETHLKQLSEKIAPGKKAKDIKVMLTPSPADSMVKYLEESKADLLVVATRGKTGLAGFFGSSFAEHMNKFSPCDVLVLRPRD
jgi:nucleotide-binding universal stress UspA family protein